MLKRILCTSIFVRPLQLLQILSLLNIISIQALTILCHLLFPVLSVSYIPASLFLSFGVFCRLFINHLPLQLFSLMPGAMLLTVAYCRQRSAIVSSLQPCFLWPVICSFSIFSMVYHKNVMQPNMPDCLKRKVEEACRRVYSGPPCLRGCSESLCNSVNHLNIRRKQCQWAVPFPLLPKAPGMSADQCHHATIICGKWQHHILPFYFSQLILLVIFSQLMEALCF